MSRLDEMFDRETERERERAKKRAGAAIIEKSALYRRIERLESRVDRLEQELASLRGDRADKVDAPSAAADVENDEIELNDPAYLLRLQRSIDEYPISRIPLPPELRLCPGAPSIERPAHELRGAVDLRRYLSCFTYLRMEDGWEIDYVYCLVRPFVYARRVGEPPIDYKEYKNRYFVKGEPDKISTTNAFIRHIRHDTSTPGRFELAIFAMTAHIFYLQDHGYYEHTDYMYTPDLFWRAFNNSPTPLNLPDDGIERAKRYVGYPMLKVGIDDSFRVSVMCRSMNTGVVRRNIFFHKGEIFSITDDTIVPPAARIFF